MTFLMALAMLAEATSVQRPAASPLADLPQLRVTAHATASVTLMSAAQLQDGKLASDMGIAPRPTMLVDGAGNPRPAVLFEFN